MSINTKTSVQWLAVASRPVMADRTFVGFLSNLVASGVFKSLHERLIKFFDESCRNSCDENAAACCELIENHAKLQGQLFRLLNLCTAEGGLYEGSDVLKKKLLPWLCNSSFLAKYGAEELVAMREKYEWKVKKLEDSLSASKIVESDVRMK